MFISKKDYEKIQVRLKYLDDFNDDLKNNLKEYRDEDFADMKRVLGKVEREFYQMKSELFPEDYQMSKNPFKYDNDIRRLQENLQTALKRIDELEKEAYKPKSITISTGYFKLPNNKINALCKEGKNVRIYYGEHNMVKTLSGLDIEEAEMVYQKLLVMYGLEGGK